MLQYVRNVLEFYVRFALSYKNDKHSDVTADENRYRRYQFVFLLVSYFIAVLVLAAIRTSCDALDRSTVHSVCFAYTFTGLMLMLQLLIALCDVICWRLAAECIPEMQARSPVTA